MCLLLWPSQGEKLVCETALGSGSTVSSAGAVLRAVGSQGPSGLPKCHSLLHCHSFQLEGPCMCSWHGLWLALCLSCRTAVPDSHLSSSPSRRSSLPCAGHHSVCGPHGDVLILVLWVQVSSRAVCDVGDLPSWNLTFSLVVCDLQVTGTRVPELRCQPAPTEPLAWLEGASLHFPSQNPCELAGSPQSHVSVLCSIPAVPQVLSVTWMGVTRGAGLLGSTSLLRTPALLRSPLTVLKDAPSAQALLSNGFVQ